MKTALWKMELKRSFCNVGFWLALVLLLGIFAHGIWVNTDFRRENSTYEIIVSAMALSGFTPFAAVFPVLGYGADFCEEYQSGYLKMILSRISWKRYGRIRIFVVGLAGGITIALPIAFVCITAYVSGVHGVPENGLYMGTKMEYYLQQCGDSYLLLGKVLLGFLFGIIWAVAGLAFAVWSCNRYVAWIAPFIVYEMMWILLENVPFLNPIYLLRGDDLESYPLSALMECVLIAIAAAVCWLGMKRRLGNEKA